MLLSELAREHGVFDWLSAAAVRAADGSCVRLFTLVYAAGTIVTVFLSNDATAVVLTPAILAAVRKARVQPLPYLFVCAFVANAASFLLPISNPANLVVFHDSMPPLGQWLLVFGVPCLLAIASTYVVLRWQFRNDLRCRIEHSVEARPLNANGKLVLVGVALVVAVLLIVSTLGMDLGLPTCLAALAITALICLKERSNPLVLAREISWETLALVAGLFIMVDAMQSIGAIQYTKAWLAWAQHLGLTASWLVTGFAVGVANNLVEQSSAGLNRRQHAAGCARDRTGRSRGSDWRRPRPKSFHYGIAGDNFVADRIAQRTGGRQLLGFSEDRSDRDADRFAGLARRRDCDAGSFRIHGIVRKIKASTTKDTRVHEGKLL